MYNPKTWVTGETITAAELNALEQAAAASAVAADVNAALTGYATTSALTNKADLSRGVVPDSQLPARLQDAALGVTYVPQASPAWSTKVAPSDPARSVYNLHAGNFRRWRTALAQAKQGIAPAVLNCIGNSITFGQYATVPYRGGWVGRLRSLLDAEVGASAGTGVSWMWNVYRSQDPRLVFPGTESDTPGYGPFNSSCVRVNTPASPITFTPDMPVDSFRVFYIEQLAGYSFSLTIDGGTATIVNTGGGTQNQVGTATISAGSLGTHTLSIAVDTGAVYIVGVEGIAGTGGVKTTSIAYPGDILSDFTQPSSDGAAGYQFADALAPNLTIIQCDANEFSIQVDPIAYRDAMTTAVQRALAFGDVLLATDIPRDGNWGPIPQTTYRNVCYQVADTNGVPLLDLADRWVSPPVSSVLYHEAEGSRTHPNDAGYRDVAAAYFPVLTR